MSGAVPVSQFTSPTDVSSGSPNSDSYVVCDLQVGVSPTTYACVVFQVPSDDSGDGSGGGSLPPQKPRPFPPSPPPIPSITAWISADRAKALPGSTINFRASASGGSGGYSFLWNFGDGATGNGTSLSHIYAGVGSYNVTTTVRDSGGRISGSSFSIQIVQTLGAIVVTTSNPGSVQAPQGPGGSLTPYVPSVDTLSTGEMSASRVRLRTPASPADWSAPDAARVGDGINTTTLIDSGDYSQQLVLQDFGFNLPSSAVIEAVNVIVQGEAFGVVDKEKIDLINCSFATFTECYNRVVNSDPGPPTLQTYSLPEAIYVVPWGSYGIGGTPPVVRPFDWEESGVCGYEISYDPATSGNPGMRLNVWIAFPSDFSGDVSVPPVLGDARLIRILPRSDGGNGAETVLDYSVYLVGPLDSYVTGSVDLIGVPYTTTVNIIAKTDQTGTVSFDVSYDPPL